MGFSHLELFHRECRGQAEAVALCASDPGRIARAMEVAPEMRLFKNEHDLIHSDLDAVVVSSPNFTHVPLALEALKAGKHLFLEKPVGITPAECRKLLRASAKSDRVLLIGHELRYSPFFGKFKKLVEQLLLLTQNTRLIPSMQKTWVSMWKTCWFLNPTRVSRHWRSRICWYAPGPLISW